MEVDTWTFRGGHLGSWRWTRGQLQFWHPGRGHLEVRLDVDTWRLEAGQESCLVGKILQCCGIHVRISWHTGRNTNHYSTRM